MASNQDLISFSNETCKVGSKIIKIGDLSDEQLDGLHNFLKTRYELSKRQSRQLRAVSYIRIFRSRKDMKKLIIDHYRTKALSPEVKKKMVVANRAATIIIKWLKHNTELYKQTEIA